LIRIGEQAARRSSNAEYPTFNSGNGALRSRQVRGENRPFSRGHLYRILGNPIYLGQISHKGTVFPGQHPPIIEPPLWEAVQEQLQANLKGQRTRHNATEPSLLAGLLSDGGGNRLTTSHAKKGTRCYRYYVRPVVDGTERDAARGALRWPAQDLEDAVLDVLLRLLNDDARLVELMGTMLGRDLSDQLAFARKLAEQLSAGSLPDKVAMLQWVLSRVTVFEDRISIGFRLSALYSTNNASAQEESIIPIEVPALLKRCGMAVRLVVHAARASHRRPDPKLIALLHKADDWCTRLTSGRADSAPRDCEGGKHRQFLRHSARLSWMPLPRHR